MQSEMKLENNWLQLKINDILNVINAIYNQIQRTHYSAWKVTTTSSFKAVIICDLNNKAEYFLFFAYGVFSICKRIRRNCSELITCIQEETVSVWKANIL